MNTRVLATVSLFATIASGAFVKGACPTVKSITFNTNMTNVQSHYLLYLDQSLYKYLGLAEKVAP